MSRKPPPTKSDYDFDFKALPEIPLYALLPKKKSSAKPTYEYDEITCFPEVCRISPDARYYTENEVRLRELRNNPLGLPCSVHVSIIDSTETSTTSIKSMPRTSSSGKSKIRFATDSTASLTEQSLMTKMQQSQQFPFHSSLMPQQQMMNGQMWPMMSMPQQFPYPLVDMSQQFPYPSVNMLQFPYASVDMSYQNRCLPDGPPAKQQIISQCCLPPPPPSPPCPCHPDGPTPDEITISQCCSPPPPPPSPPCACLPDGPTPDEMTISQCCLPPSPPCPSYPPNPPVMDCSCAPEVANELVQDCMCAPPAVNNSKFVCQKPCCLANRSSITEQPPLELSSRPFAKYDDLIDKRNSFACRSSGLQPLSFSAGNNQKQNKSVTFPKKLLKSSNLCKIPSSGRINPSKSTSGRLNSTTNEPEFMRSPTLPQKNTQLVCPPSMHIFQTTSAANPSQTQQMNRMHKSQNQYQPMAKSNLSGRLQKKNGNNSYSNGEFCGRCGGIKNGYVNENANGFQNFNGDRYQPVNLYENNINGYCSMEDAFAVSGNGSESATHYFNNANSCCS